MGSTDKIKTPSDLYKIDGDEHQLNDDQKNLLLQPLSEQDWAIINNL